MANDFMELARPDLPLPTCRVILVCGPPAAGKSTYVKQRARPEDIVVDLDLIARGCADLEAALIERNKRLAALSIEPEDRRAWVIVCAPSQSLRAWWASTLGAEQVVLLNPARPILLRRVAQDPSRKFRWQEQVEAIDKWIARERDNYPGMMKSACDADGYPVDPLHPWNR